nr:arabinosidase [Muribaculaceae bacterium]
MKFNSKTYLLGLSALAFAAQAQVGVNIDLGKRGPAIGDLHYGIFYEEINHAGDGGLYAELLRNRSFEDNANNPETWTKVGKAGYALVHDNLLPNNASALEVTFNQPGDGFSNNGYWGINTVEGRKYD